MRTNAAQQYFLRAAIVALAFGLPMQARADMVVAQTGFNDAAGINSNPVPGSPYSLGLVAGAGGVEPGWLGPWSDGPMIALVQNVATFEGDQALRIPATTAPSRALATPVTGTLTIEQAVRFDAGARLVAYTELEATGESIANQGAVWQAFPDNSFRVVDGMRDGCIDCPVLITPFQWSPGVWYQVTTMIDVAAGTWDFFVDGVHYDAPHPLGFRGAPLMLDRIRYLSEGP